MSQSKMDNHQQAVPPRRKRKRREPSGSQKEQNDGNPDYNLPQIPPPASLLSSIQNNNGSGQQPGHTSPEKLLEPIHSHPQEMKQHESIYRSNSMPVKSEIHPDSMRNRQVSPTGQQTSPSGPASAHINGHYYGGRPQRHMSENMHEHVNSDGMNMYDSPLHMINNLNRQQGRYDPSGSRRSSVSSPIAGPPSFAVHNLINRGYN